MTDRAGNSAAFASPFVRIDKTPPSIAFVSRLPAANPAGWNNSDIAVTWSCADALSGPAGTPIAQTLTTDGANQSLTGTCADRADNTTSDTRGGLNLDKTPPSIACAANPSMLWPPNNKMVGVQVAMTFTDSLSGTSGFGLTAASNNETGTADIAGFVVGQPVLSGSLLAQRSGNGNGRIYTLGYRGSDAAGNTATCSTTVTVPHSMSDAKQ